jgi:hypothetical protein
LLAYQGFGISCSQANKKIPLLRWIITIVMLPGSEALVLGTEALEAQNTLDLPQSPRGKGNLPPLSQGALTGSGITFAWIYTAIAVP